MTFLLYVAASAAGGLIVGVLGTGSSLILLPSLTLIFEGAMPAQDPIRLAAGTTMATIAVGAIAGAVAQYRRRNFDAGLFRLTLPPYVLGGFAGPWVSRLLPADILGVYVAVVVAIVALRMLLADGPGAKGARDYDAHRLEITLVLLAIGFGCSLAGIASGIFAIPYLARFALPIRSVIGTSTASAAVYASCGAAGYVTAGWSIATPAGGSASVAGFVYLPAFAVMALTAAIVTPRGVLLAGKVSERALKRAFAVFLLAAAVAIVL